MKIGIFGFFILMLSMALLVLVSYSSMQIGIEYGKNSIVPEKNDITLPKITTRGENINGFFDGTSGILVVYTKNMARNNMYTTVLHEIGHYEYTQLTGNEIANSESEAFAQQFAVNHSICEVK